MRRQHRLILDSIMLGVVGALAAQIFMFFLRWAQRIFLIDLAGYHPPGLPAEGGVLQQSIGPHGLLLIPLATTLGGLISGLLVYTFAPEAEGHGTDTAVKAFHQAGGFIRHRVAPLKTIASAVTIGSGGAAGREGPTALIAAGVGSSYATIFKRSEQDRRLLVLIGMASGLSAIFRSPIGTAFFAIEVLYADMEFEAGALLYTLLGSIVAYTINGLFVGWEPLFLVPSLPIPQFGDYLWYAVLGIIAGVVATILPTVFYGTRDLFHKIPIPPHVKPAIGGLGVGLIAIGLPQILGGGYGWIQEAMDGRLGLELVGILIFAKMVAFALTVSSGGSGGVFAPSLFVGAMVGATVAQFFHLAPAPYVIAGMAAVFGGAARVPIATLFMVTEMTGGYHLVVAAALAVTLSYFVQVLLSTPLKYKSLYEAQVPTRADSPAHFEDHVEMALRILRRHKIALPDDATRVDLRAVLASGVPLDLPDGKRVVMGRIEKKSPYARQPVEKLMQDIPADEGEVVAIFRNGHTLIPHKEMRLEVGDLVLLILPRDVWARIAAYFTPLTPPEEEPQQKSSDK